MKKNIFILCLCLVLLAAVIFQKPITRLLNYSSGTFFDTVLSGKALPTRVRISVSPLSENEETPFLTEGQLDELNDFLTSAVLETVVKSSEIEGPKGKISICCTSFLTAITPLTATFPYTAAAISNGKMSFTGYRAAAIIFRPLQRNRQFCPFRAFPFVPYMKGVTA